MGIFRIKDVQAGNTTTARQILNQAEQRIPIEFGDQPERRDELLAAIADVNCTLDQTIPAAMILEARGAIQLHSPRGDRARPVPQTLLYPDDRLTLAADAQVRLVFLSERTTRVGAYPSNKLGLCDMHGNVWQWTDTASGLGRVIRGGGWYGGGPFCLATFRYGRAPTDRNFTHGFRLVRVPVR